MICNVRTRIFDYSNLVYIYKTTLVVVLSNSKSLKNFVTSNNWFFNLIKSNVFFSLKGEVVTTNKLHTCYSLLTSFFFMTLCIPNDKLKIGMALKGWKKYTKINWIILSQGYKMIIYWIETIYFTCFIAEREKTITWPKIKCCEGHRIMFLKAFR